jgi:hypothetical protein
MLTLGALLLGLIASLVAAAQPAQLGRFTADTPIDILLGKLERARFAAALDNRAPGGRTYPWSQYAAWGKELVLHGQVRQPPEGPAPSKLLAERYRCVHCHNLQREDARLPIQDPEAREKLIRKQNPADPSRRDGEVLHLAPGTTLWGSPNRETFYNAHFAKYRNQKLISGQPMDPTKLVDAIAVCCRFCSGGRYPEQWELDAMLAYHWELELKLKDLNLPADQEQRVLAALNTTDAQAIAAARQTIRQSILKAAGATKSAVPDRSEGDTDFYPDSTKITGNAKLGQFVYQSACAGCHGTAVNSLANRALLMDDKRFHFYTREGTERDGLYMPMMSAERLSRPQAADVRAYLRTLPR